MRGGLPPYTVVLVDPVVREPDTHLVKINLISKMLQPCTNARRKLNANQLFRTNRSELLSSKLTVKK